MRKSRCNKCAAVLPYYGKSLSRELLEAQMPWGNEVQHRYRNASKITTE